MAGTNAWKTAYLRRHPARRLVSLARYRAKRNGVPFSLTAEDILPLPTHCPVFGTKLRAGSSDNAPTLDRVVPSRGYIKSNVRVISAKANRIKSNATLAELKRVLEYVKKNLQPHSPDS